MVRTQTFSLIWLNTPPSPIQVGLNHETTCQEDYWIYSYGRWYQFYCALTFSIHLFTSRDKPSFQWETILTSDYDCNLFCLLGWMFQSWLRRPRAAARKQRRRESWRTLESRAAAARRSTGSRAPAPAAGVTSKYPWSRHASSAAAGNTHGL